MSNTSTNIAWLVTAVAAFGGVMLLKRSRQSNIPSLVTNNNTMNTDKNLPRGYRNNNPLNIRISSNAWKGKVTPNTDGAFEQFISMPYGYRAALATMRTYITKYGLNTVAKIIERWAPANENNTLAYIKHVCEFTGLDPDMVVGRNDKDTLTKMAYGMSLVENGNKEYTRALGLPNMDIINEGWRLL